MVLVKVQKTIQVAQPANSMLDIFKTQPTGDDYNTLFKYYHRHVIDKHLAIFRNEDINGNDCGHLEIALWYGSFLYAVLLKSAQNAGFKPLSEVRKLYHYDKLKTCLSCLKIPIDNFMELIDDQVEEPIVNGINTMAIEQNFIVEDCECIPVNEEVIMEDYIGTPATIAMFNELWNSNPSCKLLFNSPCNSNC